MKSENQYITLYTIQSPPAVKELTKNGLLSGFKKHAESDFLDAYNWMMQQMNTRLPKPEIKTSSPLWAWFSWNGNYKTPCDLRNSRHVERGEKAFRIKFKKLKSEILLSDFDDWHAVLNKSFLSKSEKELHYFENLKVSAKKKSSLMEKSWEQIFNLNQNQSENLSIQGTFWSLRTEEVLEVTEFIGR